MEQQKWSITINYREVTDEEGKKPVNAPIEFMIDLTQAKGLDCDAIISSAMTLAETVINHIKKVKNENNLQLEESTPSSENPGNGSFNHTT